ncbi:hypothetical protein FS837_001200 [Tulasnella sp. UAMH 9824]|nr:hypothetical protein FS837_001200 [Tulasnella sp. UAMH 9824]
MPMDWGILSTLKRKTRKHIKSVLDHRLARARKRIALKEANKPPERSHGDERIRDECHKEFKSFSKEVRDLGHKFEEFMRAIRPIGSSSGLICTSKDLQQYMNDVLYGFRSNSAEIWRVFAARSGSDEMPDDLQGSLAPAMSLLPNKMGVLSEGLNAFLNGLRDIPEFSDKLLTDSLLEFRDWLVYRAECLQSCRDASVEGSAATRRYISQVMKEMSLYIRKAGVALQAFTEGGAKAIQDYQERSQGKLQNMSTVCKATFFSGVTATTMQYAMNQEREGGDVQIAEKRTTK